MPSTDLPTALKALSDYLNDPASDFEPAGRDVVVQRLSSDFEEWMSEEDDSPIIALALSAVMEGMSPFAALVDLGILDGA